MDYYHEQSTHNWTCRNKAMLAVQWGLVWTFVTVIPYFSHNIPFTSLTAETANVVNQNAVSKPTWILWSILPLLVSILSNLSNKISETLLTSLVPTNLLNFIFKCNVLLNVSQLVYLAQKSEKKNTTYNIWNKSTYQTK